MREATLAYRFRVDFRDVYMSTPMKKISKAEADYKSASGSRRCSNCSMFSDGTCSLVAGPIRASDTCKYWRAKSAKK